MKPLFLFLFIGGCSPLFAQQANKFQSLEFVEKLIKTQWKKNGYYRNELVEGSIRDLVLVNGNPVKVKANYSLRLINSGINSGELINQVYWIEISYDKQLPFAFTTNFGRVNWSPVGIDASIDQLFTATEIATISRLHKAHLQKVRLASPSFQQVVAKWNSYPASYSATGNLQAVEKTDTYLHTNTKMVQINVGKEMEVEEKNTVQVTHSYYLNISNHPVLIRGIGRGLNRQTYEYEYMDLSRVVQPGETTFTDNIKYQYDDFCDCNEQYIAEIGIIRSDNLNGKSDPLEVNELLSTATPVGENVLKVTSANNYTNVNCKAGEKITFSVTGSIVAGPLVGPMTANGLSGISGPEREKGFVFGALLGRIGNGPWFLVGESTTIMVTSSGVLQLKVNDRNFENNKGHFLVTYSVSK